MCGHLKTMWTWQQRGCRCWTAAEGGFDQDAISAIAQPSFVHICQFFRGVLVPLAPSQFVAINSHLHKYIREDRIACRHLLS